MFRASPRPSSRAYTTALGASGFTVGGKQLECCWSWSGRPRPTMLQPLLSDGKTRGSYCSCTLLMMGGEMPETCWATHKPQVINLWNCCILLVELFESYDDARTCEHQISKQLHLCIQNLVAIATSHLGSEDPWVNGWTKYKVRILKRIQIKYF